MMRLMILFLILFQKEYFFDAKSKGISLLSSDGDNGRRFNFPEKDPEKRLGRRRWRGSIYPTTAVSENSIFQSRFEMLSNGAILFPNDLYILLGNTNTLPKTAF